MLFFQLLVNPEQRSSIPLLGCRLAITKAEPKRKQLYFRPFDIIRETRTWTFGINTALLIQIPLCQIIKAIEDAVFHLMYNIAYSYTLTLPEEITTTIIPGPRWI